MKKKIQEMIALIKSGKYDQEATHGEYDSLLEEYIQAMPRVNPKDVTHKLMLELIELEKDFWYA